MKFSDRLFVRYLALAGLLLFMQVCGLLLVRNSMLDLTDLSVHFILLCLKKEFFFTNMLALVLAVPVAAIAQWRGGRSRAAIGVTALAVGAGISLVGASWAQYNSIGAFATLDSFSMALTNPVLITEHAFGFQPVLVTAVFAVFAVVLVLGTWLVVRTESIRRAPVVRAVGLVLLLAAVLANWTSFPGSRTGISDARTFLSKDFGKVQVIQDFLEQCYQSRTGPLTALYCQWANRKALLESLTPHPNVQAVNPPLESPQEWAEGAEATNKPNVLFLVVESLRADVIYADGKFRDIMPNVTALAEDGAFFTQYYTLATHSNYADIVPISSQYPLRSPYTHVYPKHPSYPTPRIYDLLKTQGYRTAIISSQNEGWGGMINYLSSPSLDVFMHSPNFDAEAYHEKNGVDVFSIEGDDGRVGKIDDHYTVSEAIDWIRQDPDRPFYIYSNYQNSHFPYSVPEGYPRPFAPEPFDVEVGFNSVPPEYLDIVRRRYYDSLHYIDIQIGRLIQSLKDSGRYDNTLIIVTGDTAQAFGEHGFSGHANMLYDETLRTPLIVHGPGIKPEIVHERYCHLDVPPTILGQLGLPPYPGFQGVDALDRSQHDSNRMIFLTVQSPYCNQFGVLYKNLKFFTDPITGADYLFMLDRDPGEQRNLAHALPELSEELHEVVDAWRYYQLSYYSDAKQQATTFPPVLTLKKTEPQQNGQSASETARHAQAKDASDGA